MQNNKWNDIYGELPFQRELMKSEYEKYVYIEPSNMTVMVFDKRCLTPEMLNDLKEMSSSHAVFITEKRPITDIQRYINERLYIDEK